VQPCTLRPRANRDLGFEVESSCVARLKHLGKVRLGAPSTIRMNGGRKANLQAGVENRVTHYPAAHAAEQRPQLLLQLLDVGADAHLLRFG